MELDEEGVVDLLEDLALAEDGLELLLAHDLVLVEDLHGVEAARIPLPDQDHSGKAAPTDDLDLLEVLLADLIAVGVGLLLEC